MLLAGAMPLLSTDSKKILCGCLGFLVFLVFFLPVSHLGPGSQPFSSLRAPSLPRLAVWTGSPAHAVFWGELPLLLSAHNIWRLCRGYWGALGAYRLQQRRAAPAHQWQRRGCGLSPMPWHPDRAVACPPCPGIPHSCCSRQPAPLAWGIC